MDTVVFKMLKRNFKRWSS